MVVYNSDIVETDCEPGVRRKILAYSKELMMCEITFEKGSRGLLHSHQNRQITYIIEGKFEFLSEGEVHIVSAGDSLFFPGDSLHSAICLERGKLIDVFNPMRNDFIGEPE